MNTTNESQTCNYATQNLIMRHCITCHLQKCVINPTVEFVVVVFQEHPHLLGGAGAEESNFRSMFKTVLDHIREHLGMIFHTLIHCVE